jgi:hypothetical protein
MEAIAMTRTFWRHAVLRRATGMRGNAYVLKSASLGKHLGTIDADRRAHARTRHRHA